MKINKRAARRLARAWGVTWPIDFVVEPLGRYNGVCLSWHKRHEIKLDPQPDRDPELVLRHEIGHAVDFERRVYVRHEGKVAPATKEILLEACSVPYRQQTMEIAARSFEQRDLGVRLCDVSHTKRLAIRIRKR